MAPAQLDGGHLSAWPPPCGEPRPIYSGTLCGTAAKRCQVEVNETVVDNTNVRPGLSLELDESGNPMALYRTDWEKPIRFIRRLGPNKWSEEPTPESIQYAALGRKGGEPYLFASFAKSRSQLFRRTASGWSVLAHLPAGIRGGWHNGMMIDQSGCQHLRAHKPRLEQNARDTERVVYGLRTATGAWSLRQLSHGLGGGPIALSPSGRPHFAYWGRLDPQAIRYSLIWVASSGKPESVIQGGNTIHSSRLDLAVTANEGDLLGTPHIFAQRSFGDTAGELTLASRSTNGYWTLRTIATTPAANGCYTAPTAPGQTCVTEYRVYEAHALLPGRDLGKLRMLYGLNHQVISRTASCPGSDAEECTWKTVSNEITGALLIGAINGAQVEQTTVLDGLIPTYVVARIDSKGRIHVLIGGTPDDHSPLSSALYYIRLGHA